MDKNDFLKYIISLCARDLSATRSDHGCNHVLNRFHNRLHTPALSSHQRILSLADDYMLHISSKNTFIFFRLCVLFRQTWRCWKPNVKTFSSDPQKSLNFFFYYFLRWFITYQPQHIIYMNEWYILDLTILKKLDTYSNLAFELM